MDPIASAPADETRPTLTVVIPMRNEEATIEACLASVRANPLPDGVTAEILVRQGARTALRLVLEALRERNTPAHRVRVLGVLKRIAAGPGLEILDVMDLNGLLFAKNKAVREAAFRFFDKDWSPGTVAGVAAAAATTPV